MDPDFVSMNHELGEELRGTRRRRRRWGGERGEHIIHKFQQCAPELARCVQKAAGKEPIKVQVIPVFD